MKTIHRIAAIALPLLALTGSAYAQTTAAPPPPASVKKGLTWGVYPADPITGTATVSCQGAAGGGQTVCNAYQGDYPGTQSLPVLCFHALNMPNPVPNTAAPTYWSGGVIATTPSVSPTAMGWQHRSQVDSYCAKQFGKGWVVAEHHMGGNHGWKFSAYGNVGQPGRSRFWVNINDQANATLWDQH